MSQDTILKDFIEKQSGYTVESFVEDKPRTLNSLMCQRIILEGITYVFRMTHTMNGLDVWYFRKGTN